ncbi:MAG: hypothetical protein U1B84_01940, partial [Variovorax sp.]|nr:hypothetical protein [Variovorax sp.]
LKDKPNAILFIDEIHTLIGAGSSDRGGAQNHQNNRRELTFLGGFLLHRNDTMGHAGSCLLPVEDTLSTDRAFNNVVSSREIHIPSSA